MFSGRRLVEQQWCVSLEDCTLVPLIVMVKELVALGGELKIGNYTIEVYQLGVYMYTD